MKEAVYNSRFYRQWMNRRDLCQFQVKVAESDLYILSDRVLKIEALDALKSVRREIETYMTIDPLFGKTLIPHEILDFAPTVVRQMARAADSWQVGPMAAVAGAVAQAVCLRLAELSDSVMVENGGDVFAISPTPVRFVLYAGATSPFTDKIRFEVDAKNGIGVCTSSKTIGPSLSLGRADAVVAIATDGAIADAAATSLANRILNPEDVSIITSEQE